MPREIAVRPSEDTMQSTLTIAEVARIEELLSRLDPSPIAVCRIPGCLHLHVTSTTEGGATALAA
jgi:hypothetical protein